MPDTLDALSVCRRAANAFLKRHRGLDREEVHGQAGLILAELLARHDPARGPLDEYLAWTIPRRLIDWLRSSRGVFPHRRPRPRTVNLRSWDDVPAAGAGLPPDTEAFLEAVRRLVGERDWPIVVATLAGRSLRWAGEQMGVCESAAWLRREKLFARLRESAALAALLGGPGR